MATGLGWAADGESAAQHHVGVQIIVRTKTGVETLYKEDLGH